MQIAESTRVSPPDLEENPVIAVLSDEIVVLAEGAGIAIGPCRGFSPFIRRMPGSSKSELAASARAIEIPLVGHDGEISGILYREIRSPAGAVPMAHPETPSPGSTDEIVKVFVHDINNVLSVIAGGLRLLQRQDHAEGGQAIFDRLHRAIDRGTRLSRSLLDAGRPLSSPTRQYAGYADLAGGIEALAHALCANTQLEVAISPDLWEFDAEPEQLYFALLNLCRNADAAMSVGGVLSISAGNVSPVSAAPEGAVMITVKDNGAGMAPEILARAFEPYYTTKPTGDGSGLGLYQVRKFVEQRGGAIRLESEVGVGTTVRMVFPRVYSNVKNDFPVVHIEAQQDAEPRARAIGYVPSPTGGAFVLTATDEDDV